MESHIAAMLDAIDEGCDVRGYYAWSPFDLYSWKNGPEKRYGLVAINYEKGLKRIPKKSYGWFKRVIETGGALIHRSSDGESSSPMQSARDTDKQEEAVWEFRV